MGINTPSFTEYNLPEIIPSYQMQSFELVNLARLMDPLDGIVGPDGIARPMSDLAKYYEGFGFKRSDMTSLAIIAPKHRYKLVHTYTQNPNVLFGVGYDVRRSVKYELFISNGAIQRVRYEDKNTFLPIADMSQIKTNIVLSVNQVERITYPDESVLFMGCFAHALHSESPSVTAVNIA